MKRDEMENRGTWEGEKGKGRKKNVSNKINNPQSKEGMGVSR